VVLLKHASLASNVSYLRSQIGINDLLERKMLFSEQVFYSTEENNLVRENRKEKISSVTVSY